MRLLCYRCGEWLVTEKTGVTVRPEGYAFGFHADLMKCPKCGMRVLVTANAEDTSIKHPEIQYTRRDEEPDEDVTYVVEVRKTFRVVADNRDEAIDMALSDLEEVLAEPLDLEEIFEVYAIPQEGKENGDKA